MDYGHKLTDEELKELEKRINAEYTQAEKEVAQKLSNYLAGFMRRDIEQKTLVDAGEISEREYLNWRAGQIATGKRWEELRQSLAEDMHRTNVEAQKQAQSESMDIYALNHNYGTYEVENGAEIDTKYTLYDRQTVERLVKDNPQMLPPPGKKVSERIKAGLDVRWNNQHIQSVMMQSLLQGESIGKIATRLANAVGDSNRAAAIRNARTMTTGAENAGRVDAYERAKDMGVPVRQMWVATIDDRTRESHRKMDGETIEPGETFSNKCRFPGDPLGEPSEVYNCRCTLVARIPGVQYTFAERGTDKDSYEEWKKGKETEEKPQVEEQKTEEPKVEEKLWTDRIKEIQSQDVRTEADIKEAGQLIAEQVHTAYLDEKIKERDALMEKVDEAKKKYDDIRAQSNSISSEPKYREAAILNRGYMDIENAQYFNSIEDAQKYYDEKYKILVEIDKERDAAFNEYKVLKEQSMGYGDYAESSAFLFDLLSQVREMGSDGIDVGDHMNNSRSPVRKCVEWAYSKYPKSWVEQSVADSSLTVKKVSRGYYSDWQNIIAISGTDMSGNRTATHELGHRFEHIIPGLKEIEKEFYDRRTEGEKLQWLGYGYARNEVTRKDDFVDAYMGKSYEGRAYELVSMGFELAYCDPVKLAKDEDMEQWIYGILATVGE
jgi:SPP1 gp7 family putative phage head morphogenesis protein